MITLDAATRTLAVVLAGAITTNQLPINATYVVYPSQRPNSAQLNTNGNTAVTVVTGQSSPSSVTVSQLTVYNADTAVATVSVLWKDSNGSVSATLFKATLAVGDSLVYADGSGFQVLDQNGNLKQGGAGTSGRLLRAPQILTSGTSYVPPANCNAIRVTCWGGGGGGGGTTSSAANAAAGGGGGSGAKVIKYYISPPNPCTYAIGGAGTAGSSSAGNGGVGGDTTFTDGTTLITAKGGLGGTGSAFGTTAAYFAPGGGVVGTNGDINGKGSDGTAGQVNSGTVGASGHGGSTDVGGGGVGLVAGAAGNAGVGFGAGGGGGLVLNGSAAVAGGAGAAGGIMIEEFS